MDNQELEIKFFVRDLDAVAQRLLALGAHLEAERVFEINLRFDERDGRLTQSAQSLRLRQDSRARLTYKGPMRDEGGARLRTEIEFTVDDFQAARAFLEALGYHVMFMYEKYRTTYALPGLEVVLDELPYGLFVEIEGQDAASLQAFSRELGLSWEAGVPSSYSSLFQVLRARLGLTFRDLTFANFEGISLRAEEMGVRPADGGS